MASYVFWVKFAKEVRFYAYFLQIDGISYKSEKTRLLATSHFKVEVHSFHNLFTEFKSVKYVRCHRSEKIAQWAKRADRWWVELLKCFRGTNLGGRPNIL